MVETAADYFSAVGQLAGRRIRFPRENQRLLDHLPSSAWFMKSDIRIDCEKVRNVTGVRPERSLAELIAPDPLGDMRAGSTDEMRQVQQSGVPFKAYGLGYSLLLNPARRIEQERRVLLEPYRGRLA